MCGKGGRALLAMLCVEFFSAAAASSDRGNDVLCTRGGGRGGVGEMGEAAGEGRGKITF